MYLKFIRHKQPCGQINRGSLYSVHFQPNEKGGYTEHLTHISDAYEIAAADQFALALIYPAGVTQKNGRMCRRGSLRFPRRYCRRAYAYSSRRSLYSRQVLV